MQPTPIEPASTTAIEPLADTIAPQPMEQPTETLLAMLPHVDDPALKRDLIATAGRYQINRLNYAEDLRLARMLYQSGQFNELKKLTPDQGVALALAKLQFGRQQALSQMQSMRCVVFISGRPTFENSVVAEKLADAGYGWDVEFAYADGVKTKSQQDRPGQECVSCTVWLKKYNPTTREYEPMLDRHKNQISETFGKAEADSIDIYEDGKTIKLSQKFNYKSWAKDMFYWRCIARIKKFYAPNVMRGSVPMYVEALDAPPFEGAVEVIAPVVDNAPAAEARPEPTLSEHVAATAKSLFDDPAAAQQ